jgi:hypothetical protein
LPRLWHYETFSEEELPSAVFSDWALSDSDIDQALMEVEILRARLRIALARG